MYNKHKVFKQEYILFKQKFNRESENITSDIDALRAHSEVNAMNNSKKQLLTNYLSNMAVELSTVALTKCPPSWRRMDDIPSYSKFYYILDGEGYLKIGKQEFFPKPGQLFLMPEGAVQSFSTISANTFLKYWCHFKVRTGNINLFSVINTPCYIDVKDAAFVEQIFSRLLSLKENKGLLTKFRMNMELSSLLSYFLENIPESQISVNTSAYFAPLSKIVEYIETHLSENITIRDLAKEIHLHPNSFTRLFKAHIGVTPIEYLLNKRIEKAKHLLSTTDISVQETASVAGFKDQFYFSKQFKKNVGYSPSEYKLLMQDNAAKQ